MVLLGAMEPGFSPPPRPADREKDPEYWRGQAQETLRAALRLQRLNQNVAKNLILFLGDGEMGAPTTGGWVPPSHR